MPIVELVAQKALERHPDTELELVDMIILLWLYSNPYDSNRRQLSSIKNILKMSHLMQTAGATVAITDDELTQIVLGSLRKLQKQKFLYLQSAGVHYLKGTLTEKGVTFIEKAVSTPALKRITAEFGNNP